MLIMLTYRSQGEIYTRPTEAGSARVKEGPFHFAFGCQDRADLVLQLRAALEAPPARTDEELFRWLMSTARVGRPAHVFYEHLVRCRARRMLQMQRMHEILEIPDQCVAD